MKTLLALALLLLVGACVSSQPEHAVDAGTGSGDIPTVSVDIPELPSDSGTTDSGLEAEPVDLGSVI